LFLTENGDQAEIKITYAKSDETKLADRAAISLKDLFAELKGVISFAHNFSIFH
jgi:hypothetical protein